MAGYTAVMPWQGIPLEEAMPACERGETFTVEEIKLVEKQTSPPDYLTEAELITLMEKHGIGIPRHCLEAVIFVHIILILLVTHRKPYHSFGVLCD